MQLQCTFSVRRCSHLIKEKPHQLYFSICLKSSNCIKTGIRKPVLAQRSFSFRCTESKHFTNYLLRTLSDFTEKHSTVYRHTNSENERLYKIIKSAYIHPTEKKLIDNPILIFCDSYRFAQDIKEEDMARTYDYSIIIKRVNNNKNSIISENKEDIIEEIL